MCRWLAYSGSPVNVEDLLYKPKNSLVVQSRHAKMGVDQVNGDGFGIGWYDDREDPVTYRSTEPAWNDRNLRELAGHVVSGKVFAHIRASTGTPIQQSNCHPFRFGRWLWMHNGAIAEFSTLKRDLVLAIAPELYPHVEGSTDTEVFFYLALTLGLRNDPPAGVARAVGVIEQVAQRHRVQNALQMTVATTDGTTLWAFRYSSERDSRSLFHSIDMATVRDQYPDSPTLQHLSEDARLVVSEPLGDLKGVWKEVPESTSLIVRGGEIESRPFVPIPPA